MAITKSLHGLFQSIGGIKKYFYNSFWMLLEYFFRVASSIFVGIYVARYLGPEQYGIINYSLTIVVVFMTISRLGMDSILVRELTNHAKLMNEYLGTAFILVLLSSFLCLAGVLLLFPEFESDSNIVLYVWVISIGMVFQAFNVFEYAFQSRLQTKYSSVAKTIVLFLGGIVKVLLVYYEAELIMFAISYLLDYLLIGVGVFVMYQRINGTKMRYPFNVALVKPLLAPAWPMVLSSVAIMLHLRVDQIMIKEMLNVERLGVYLAASKLFDAWIMIPYLISVSLLPAILKMKGVSVNVYESGIVRIFALVFWMGVVVALITTFIGESLILFVFGEEYIDAAEVLSIVMWTASFAGINSMTARYLTAEQMESRIVVRAFVGLLCNVLLNVLLIPEYGIRGAAFATLISIVIVSYFLDFFDKELRALTVLKNRAIFLRL